MNIIYYYNVAILQRKNVIYMIHKLLKNKIVIAIIGIIAISGISGGSYALLKQAERRNNVNIRFINHASILIKFQDTLIYVDPYEISEFSDCMPADYIFITHNHTDHYDIDSIEKIYQDSTVIIAPTSCNDICEEYEVFGVIPEQNYTLDELKIETIPMDTFNEGHPRSAMYNGYVITINGISIYHSGDTRLIDEIKDLNGKIDVACIPIGGQCSSMGVFEGSQAVGYIEPRYVIPIHYSEHTNVDLFKDYCAGRSKSTVVIMDSEWFLVK